MRAFLILCCLATAYAASLGYDYERNNGAPAAGNGGFGSGIGSNGGGNGGFGAGIGGFGNGAGNGGFGNGAGNGGFGNGAGNGGFGNGAGNGAGDVGSRGSDNLGEGISGGNDGGAVGAAPAEFTKEFFTYSAPEGEFGVGADDVQNTESLKKSLRVVFIKGPEGGSGLENAALQLAKSASEDRTAIYVLQKQADISDLANKLSALKSSSSSSNKPEVHFVKYRTNADAENAQRAIQGQYNNLGGGSSNHDGGVAPVLDFASKAPAPAASYNGGNQGGVSNGDNAGTYLPPNRRF